jgi:hypothetical protein
MKYKRIKERTIEVFVVTKENIHELNKKYGYGSAVIEDEPNWYFECYTKESRADVYVGDYLVVEADPEDKYYECYEVFSSGEDLLKVYEVVL